MDEERLRDKHDQFNSAWQWFKRQSVPDPDGDYAEQFVEITKSAAQVMRNDKRPFLKSLLLDCIQDIERDFKKRRKE